MDAVIGTALCGIFLLWLPTASSAQSPRFLRSTVGAAGSSCTVEAGDRSYFAQQSVGQRSVSGSRSSGHMVLSQGFLQPLGRNANTSNSSNLDALLFPNPFSALVSVAFSERIEEDLWVVVSDMLGHEVYRAGFGRMQRVDLELSKLANGPYILRITSGGKHFIAHIQKS
ncbi:MAG: T9SS type A sorting domain-containing protein [Flavobacteriales bacterium]|nr:T9SS type A sorting domain-containing protein [Flavobacteriales bacterium]